MHGVGATGESGQAQRSARRRPIDRDQLLEWVLGAQPGARLIYGNGEHASQVVSDDVNDELKKLEGQGYIYLFHGKTRPMRFTHDYIAERSSRQVTA